jgi:hypothetical protein
MRWLLWDCDPDSLDPREHGSFLIRRILESGDWNAITWLRRQVGDTAILEWFVSKRGGGLDPRRLRFWELILDLPKGAVDEWVAKTRLSTWHNRMSA